MAASTFETELYSVDKFVESAGTVLFRLSTREICIIRDLRQGNYVLPKGRRNVGEPRQVTAIRETMEETGITCSLLPVGLSCRACPPDSGTEQIADEARFYEGVVEPFAMYLRRLGEGDVKLVWWYVAAVHEAVPIGKHEADKFDVEFCGYDQVLQKLKFKDDRQVISKALGLVQSTLKSK